MYIKLIGASKSAMKEKRRKIKQWNDTAEIHLFFSLSFCNIGLCDDASAFLSPSFTLTYTFCLCPVHSLIQIAVEVLHREKKY